MPERGDRGDERRTPSLAKGLTAYSIILGYVMAGILLGLIIDKWLSTKLGYILGALVSFIGMIFSLYKLLS